jgi:predicted dehydrogenase
MEKIKVGLIGAGQIVETAHLPAYMKHKDEIEIEAICDIHMDRARQMADKYGIRKVYDSHTEMLKECRLDAVSVCVTNRFHAIATIDALDAGCHVLCEKPPAMSHEEALAMYEASKRNNRILSFNFHFRHAEEVKTIKGLIDDGMFGDIYAARVQALRRRGIPGWGNFTNKEIQGGGPLIDIGIHMLDTALYLMGFPEPEYVSAGAHQRIGNKPGIGLMGPWDHTRFTVEDSLFGFIHFKNGATLNLETSFALNMKEESVMNVHLFGEKAGAALFPLQVFSQSETALTDLEFPYLQEIDKRYESIADFINSCTYNKQPLYRAEESVIIQKLIDALYESSGTGQPVKW